MSKFKNYIIEKINKQEFNSVLKTNNINAGCEFEFYLNTDSTDFIFIKDLNNKVKEEVDKFQIKITNYYNDIKKAKDKKQENIIEINILNIENDKLNSKIKLLNTDISKDIQKIIDEYNQQIIKNNNKIIKLQEYIDNIDNNKYIDDLLSKYNPIPTNKSLSEYFKLMNELYNYGIDVNNLKLEKTFNDKCKEWFINNDILYPEQELGYDIQDKIADLNDDIDKETIRNLNFPFDLNDWEVKEDSSLNPGGIEIVTPILELSDLLEKIEIIFNWIDDNGETDNNTGFHVHLSMKSDNKLDPLKLILFTEEDLIYKYFESRKDNTFSLGIKNYINSFDEPFTKKDIINFLQKDEIDKKLNTNKYLGIHLIDLENNHIEFRYMGGVNYERKFIDVRKIIINYAYWLSIALDPNYKRKEYILKLNRLTNYFNALYYFNLIKIFKKMVLEYKVKNKIDSIDIDKKVNKYIKKYEMKLKALPKLKNYNIINDKFNLFVLNMVSELFVKFKKENINEI